MPALRTRQRQAAISRKGAYEHDFLFEEEEHIVAPQHLKLKDEPLIKEPTLPSSPISVASVLEKGLPDVPVEITSLTLPGSWVVVGKGGRPLKNEKMYDEPVAAAKTKKKKKKKTRKALAEPEPLVVALEEAPSSSKCLREFERASSVRNKQNARAKDAKYWAGYQQAKQLQRGALAELVAALSISDDEEAEAPLETLPAPSKTTRRDHKANSSKDKARRRARAAAAAVRCSIWQDDDAPAAKEESPSPVARLMSGELQLVAGSVGPRVTEPKPPDAWTTVGRRGKALSDFPPLQSSVKAAEPKRVAAPTETSDKPRKLARKSSAKGMNCSMM